MTKKKKIANLADLSMPIRRWLVRAPNWLGDWVMSVPFFEYLRLQCPEAHIDVIVKAELCALSARYLPVNHVYAFSKQNHKGLLGIARYARPYRGRYDVYVSLPPSFSSAWMGFCIGAPYRLGYRGEGRGLLLTHTKKRPNNHSEGMHRTATYTALLTHFFNKLGIAHTFATPCAPALRRRKEEVDRRAKESFFIGKDKQASLAAPTADAASSKTDTPIKRPLVVSLHAVGESRTLPHEAALRLLRPLARLPRAQLQFVGTNAQKKYYAALKEALKPEAQVMDFSGETNLETLAELLARADLLVGTDSGTAHLAHALGVPTVVLFGAGKAWETAPGAGLKSPYLHIMQAKDLNCAPCGSNHCRYGDTHCLRDIPPKTIVDAARRLWANRR